MRSTWAAAALAFLFGACSTTSDAFVVAKKSLALQDLLGALVALDAVPVSHQRYPDARAAALTVERRMRRGHELLLEALLLRGEWRDREAIAVLQRAREIWPFMPGLDSMILATQNRARLMRKDAVTNVVVKPPVEVPAPTREARMPAAPTAAAPMVEVSSMWGEGEVEPKAPAGDPVRSGQDPVALGLVAVEARLGRGDLEAAVAELIELSRRFSMDRRVRLRLARVLHQRALQRYGHGQLAGAIVDWERVDVLDPSNTVAKNLLAAARAEARQGTPKR